MGKLCSYLISTLEYRFDIKIWNKLKFINWYATGFVLYTEYYIKLIIKKSNNIDYYFYIKKIMSTIISIILFFCILFIFIFLCFLDTSKHLALYYLFGIIFYFFISNFNIFLKKYSNGKFTSSNQRFWKRTNIVFWIIEGFLFSLFFYYYVNSSQEPIYMSDYSSLNQEYLINLENSIISLINISFLIMLCFILLINLNKFSQNQVFILLIIINLFIFYMFLFETYQFIYLVNIFSEKNYNYSTLDSTWELNGVVSTIRVKQQYLLLCLVAKYWHFVFIFISWFYFLSKYNDNYTITYNSFGYNVQNVIILYFLNLIILIQWLKVLFKKFFENIFNCFYTNFDLNELFFFLQECFFTIIIE